MTSSESVPDGERAAGIITRGLAAVIDLLVVLLIMSALYGGLILVRLVFSPAAFSLPALNAVFSTLVTFVVAVLYLTGCWTVSGSTAAVACDRGRRDASHAPWSLASAERHAKSSPRNPAARYG